MKRAMTAIFVLLAIPSFTFAYFETGNTLLEKLKFRVPISPEEVDYEKNTNTSCFLHFSFSFFDEQC